MFCFRRCLQGDNFYPLGLNSMEQFKASFRDIYNKPNLQVPFLGVLGNHDYCMHHGVVCLASKCFY